MVIHAQALKSLNTEDFNRINEVHLRLINSLNNLRTACHNLDNQLDCQSCDREQLATCQGRLISYFYTIVEFSTAHFEHEETIMLSQSGVTKDDEGYSRHRQAHVNMLRALNEIIGECALLDSKGKTAEAYRQFCKGVSELFEEHDRMFEGIYTKR